MRTVEMRKERWRDLYRADGKTKVLYQISCKEAETLQAPPLWPEYKKERIEWAWNRYLLDLKKAEWLEDDTVPCISMVSGTEIYAEAFGARVHRPDDNMPFAIPFLFSPQEAQKVKVPRLEDTSLMRLFEMADELKRRGGDEAIFKLPDVQSPMDVVAQLWDKTDLFPNMIEEPEVVKELAEKVKQLQIHFFDEWFKRYGTAYISHCPDYYMEGGITMSIDEIGNVSAAMYEEFFKQEIIELANRYGGIGIHCCADAKHQWKYIREVPGLRMLNLYQPVPVLEESYPYFKDVTAMWPGNLEHNVAQRLTNKKKEAYPLGSRLVITEYAETKEEAIRLADRLKAEYDTDRAPHMIPRIVL
ncbi:MAG: hypothetical protein IKC46_04275 [Lachnospiraceae bacterium]|nr:hypothetical protein [Lachnospiraceae bacterium]